jgi:predicted acetyltransferase
MLTTGALKMRLMLRGTSGRLPTSSYDLLDEAGHVVGFGQLRHRPSHSEGLPDGSESHIYYQIDDAHRRRGYGTRLLALLLDEARAIGLPAVRVSCDDDNAGSRRIIEANGGKPVGEFPFRTGGRLLLFEIGLSP